MSQGIPDPEDWQGLTVDDSFLAHFLVDYPGLFPAGASWTGTLFSVSVGATASLRTNGGNFALLDVQGSSLADGNFTLVVRAVPEPASLAGVAVGLGVLLRRRRRA